MTLTASCAYIRQELKFEYPIVIECSMFNESSGKGIEAAGFDLISRAIEVGHRWKRYF